MAVTRWQADVGLVVDGDHYDLVQQVLASARVSVWIATANVKEMMVEPPIGSRARARGRFVSALERLEDLVRRGVEIRLLHAATPSRPFRDELRRRAGLVAPDWQMRCCPRCHLKLIAVDGALLYVGSANFTGAGLGAKGAGRRNFELGMLTDDDRLLDQAQARFDRIWRGLECPGCRLRATCPEPLDPAVRKPAPRASRNGSAASAKVDARSSPGRAAAGGTRLPSRSRRASKRGMPSD